MTTNPATGFVTYCVGRFLIDLPKTAKYVGGSYRHDFIDYKIKKMGADVYKQQIEQFEETLKNTKHKKNPSLLVKSMPAGKNSRVLAYWEHPAVTNLMQIHGYRWMELKEFDLGAQSVPDRADKAIQFVTEKLANIQPRKETDIPTAPGFCIDSAFLPDTGATPDEIASLTFRLSDKPDVVISIDTTLNRGAPPETLLSRKPGVLQMLGALVSGMHSVREAERTIADMPGEEWLVKVPHDEIPHQSKHMFTWETQGKSYNAAYPQIRIEAETGSSGGKLDPLPASMSEKELLKLWDAILNSIRLRPTTPGKTSDAGGPNSPSPATPKRLPLKSKVTSAVNCPQTGVWECAPNTPGISEHRRFFVAGQGMPYGLTQRPARGLGRFIGMQEDDAVEITWTLVAYDKDAS